MITANVPYVTGLSPQERSDLDALVRIFIAEKNFEGCDGLQVTDEMRVTVAAQACLLILRRDSNVIYPGLDSILIYPHAYRVSGERREGAVVVQNDDVRLGESWVRGALILAWDHVRSATHQVARGENVVLHEFAHQLDAEEGAMDGAPTLDSRERYTVWARVLGEELKDLTEKMLSGRRSDIDKYGATNPSEFFAVVTELFFERPRAMQKHHPELYAELATFYRQDPATITQTLG